MMKAQPQAKLLVVGGLYDLTCTLLGVRYGGLGVETFAIPDLRGRVTVGADAEYAPGATGGRDQLITIGVRSGTARTVGSPGSNHQPELAITYLIAIAGVVPAMS